MAGKTYLKDFERYWAKCDKTAFASTSMEGGQYYSNWIKHLAFKAYRAGVRHTNGEHSRARARYFAKHRKRS